MHTEVQFTPHEESYVRNTAEGQSLLDALSRMHPEVVIEEVNGKKTLAAEREHLRRQLAESYDGFMSNAEMPYGVKMKVARVLSGLMPDDAHTPLEVSSDIIHNDDGSVTLNTRDKDGNCMQEYRYKLSNETNEFGKPFIQSSDDSSVFGEITPDSGLMAAPIKLSLGEDTVDKDGYHHGYGLAHIEAGHGEQIRQAGHSSIEEFVENVARNYDTIREGGVVADNQTYLLEVSDEHNNTLFVQLSRDGKYWNINSAGIFNKKYSRKKSEVYTRPALESGTGTDSSGVNRGQSMGATATSRNSPSTSVGKDKDNSGEIQENGQKSASD